MPAKTSYDGDAVLQTEIRLLEPICTFRQKDGYRVFLSEAYPTYYGANGILIERSLDVSLEQWESLFESYFDSNIYGHRFFFYREQPGLEHLLREARAAEYDEADRMVGLVVENGASLTALKPGFEVRTVQTQDDWARLKAFSIDESRSEPWFSEAVALELCDKTRAVSEAIGIQWFCLHARGSDAILAKAGIFVDDGLARLQDVETLSSRRREGLASMVVSHAIRYAFDSWNAGGVAICADRDYYALDLYRKLGAQEVVHYTSLMKYSTYDVTPSAES